MKKTVLHVEGMACEHCVKAITQVVGALSGVHSVSVDLTAKTVTVEYDSAQCSDKKIESKIEDQGYEIISC